MDIALDSPTGYIFEVDLEYPQYLHDAHADLPFCSTRDKPLGKWQDKLLATLYDKERHSLSQLAAMYSWSSGNKNSSRITIRAISIRDYIQLNTNFRTRTNNDFDKNLYKLMNNAVFGKIMENVRNHVDV